MKRKPNYRRAFWITAAFVGAINVGFFVYYLSLPIVPLRSEQIGQDIPNDTLTVALLIINIPGRIVIGIFSQTDLRTPFAMALTQILSTIFWGLFGICVDWFTSDWNAPVNTSPSNPESKSNSN